MNIITSETFWTAVSSIVSTIVLIITVYQLHNQNTIQNNLDDRQDKLDERQKEIDEREKNDRETSQIIKIYTEHQLITTNNYDEFDYFETHNSSKAVALTIHNKSDYPITNVYIIGFWGKPLPSSREISNLTDSVFVFVDYELLPGSHTICFGFPERDSGTAWPMIFKVVLEDIYGQRWVKNRNIFEKLEKPFDEILLNDYGITEFPLKANEYWIVDNPKNKLIGYHGRKI